MAAASAVVGMSAPIEASTVGDDCFREGRWSEALDAFAAIPDTSFTAAVWVKVARCRVELDHPAEALRALARVVDDVQNASSWLSAVSLLDSIRGDGHRVGQTLRVAVLGTYTLSPLTDFLRLVGIRLGLDVQVYTPAFGQLHQEVLAEDTGLIRFQPDVVVIATRDGDLTLPEYSGEPERLVVNEAEQWAGLARRVADVTGARVVMHNFALKSETPFGNLASQLPGSRLSMARSVNARLTKETLGSEVLVVDCDRLAGELGKQSWFSDKYWTVSKHAVSLGVQPTLALHTMAVVAASIGMTKKCLVVDLDNTVWGGVVGEVGIEGLVIGDGPAGESYLLFQEYIAAMVGRGVLLAVCSKNDEDLARRAFENHPGMHLQMTDVSCFVANWKPKHENIKTIAERLDIGLDSLVFMDDNPAERELVRQTLPEVDVITLPDHPSGYRKALASYPWFEVAAYTPEDARRTELYRTRAETATQLESAATLEAFYESLEMVAEFAPFNEMNIERSAQLVGKTNQFNVTTRRHSMAVLRGFMEDEATIAFVMRLKDRLADHGLVGVLVAVRDGDAMNIDTWLMSCRVIGRTVERAMAAHLCQEAERVGFTLLRGRYVPTSRNHLVANLYDDLGFRRVAEEEDGIVGWEYNLGKDGPITTPYVSVEDASVSQ